MILLMTGLLVSSIAQRWLNELSDACLVDSGQNLSTAPPAKD